MLARLAELGRLSPEELEAARREPVRWQQTAGRKGLLFPFEAPHFVDLVLSKYKSSPPAHGRLRTTLDRDLQRRVQALVTSHRVRLLKSGATQAAAVIVDNRTMGVLALVGSLNYGPQDQGYNNGAAAWRSPGSILKPFLYTQALDAGFTAASVLEDVQRRYRTPKGEFIPANFDRFAHGPVSFREALGNSLNLSAVSLLNLLGPDHFYDTLVRLKLINRLERGPEHYGLGLVVGNPEVSLLQLAAAYACLANGGLYRPVRLRLDEPQAQPERIFYPQAAYIITNILADPMARARIFGSSLAMNPPYHLALKTGTSTRYRDCWIIAYTPEYTVGVWVGNFDGRPTTDLSGAVAAAPILADLTQELFRLGPPSPFPQPDGVISVTVCAFSGLKPGPGCAHQIQEFFIDGTEPEEPCTYHRPRDPWHRMPTNFAGWLHQRFAKGGEGRFRLAGFDPDLTRTFQGRGYPAGRGRTAPPRIVTLTTPGQGPAGLLYELPSPTWAPPPEPPVAIVSPLNGDRYHLEPRTEKLRLTLKAVRRKPLPTVTWFVDGKETGAPGPPYELTLDLGRGRHRLTAIGPDGQGDAVDVFVQ